MAAAIVFEHLPQAAEAATKLAPIPVKGGWGPTAYGVWTGVALFLGGMITTAIKIAPKWRELGIGRRKDELDRLSERVQKLEEQNSLMVDKLAKAERATNEVRMQMVTLNTACHLVTGELQRLDPDSAVLRQAKELIRQAASDDLGWGEEAKRLALLPGVMREANAGATP